MAPNAILSFAHISASGYPEFFFPGIMRVSPHDLRNGKITFIHLIAETEYPRDSQVLGRPANARGFFVGQGRKSWQDFSVVIGKNMPYQLLESVNIIYATVVLCGTRSDTDPGDIPELIKETVVLASSSRLANVLTQ